MKKIFLLLIILCSITVLAERPDYRILKFYSESDNYLPFEPVILHAFVLDYEGSPARPAPGLKIHIRLDTKNWTQSIEPTYHDELNQYIAKIGLLKQGEYKATLFVENTGFFTSDDLSFNISKTSDLVLITLGDIIELRKGGRAAKDDELLLWFKGFDGFNATFTAIDQNSSEVVFLVEEGSTLRINRYTLEVLRLDDSIVRFRLTKPVIKPKENIPKVMTITQAASIIEEVPCDGCKTPSGDCRLVGQHYVSGVESVFCGVDHQPYPIKTYKLNCAYGYECVDYSCFEGLCQPEVKLTWWQKLKNWLNSLFA